MTKTNQIQLFNEKRVRTVWDSEKEEWYFSIVDVVEVLTDSPDSSAYWRKLKQRLKAEGNETVTNCHGLKLPAADGKMRMADVATRIGKQTKPECNFSCQSFRSSSWFQFPQRTQIII